MGKWYCAGDCELCRLLPRGFLPLHLPGPGDKQHDEAATDEVFILFLTARTPISHKFLFLRTYTTQKSLRTRPEERDCFKTDESPLKHFREYSQVKNEFSRKYSGLFIFIYLNLSVQLLYRPRHQNGGGRMRMHWEIQGCAFSEKKINSLMGEFMFIIQVSESMRTRQRSARSRGQSAGWTTTWYIFLFRFFKVCETEVYLFENSRTTTSATIATLVCPR